MSANLKLPKKIFAHGWWTINGEKMSKSLGNVIDPIYLAEKYGIDQIRYFLLREIPFGEDGNFSELSLIKRLNSDLTNDLGNLIQRVLSMIIKYNDGKILGRNSMDNDDTKLLKLPEETFLYPAHDYKGEKVSTIGKEKKQNPRLQVNSVDEYVEIMNNLNLKKPAEIETNVAKNIKLGA